MVLPAASSRPTTRAVQAVLTGANAPGPVNGACGPANGGATCPGQQCCSVFGKGGRRRRACATACANDDDGAAASGYCGSTQFYCSNCLPGFGTCPGNNIAAAADALAPTPAPTPAPPSRCGSQGNGNACPADQCCSRYGASGAPVVVVVCVATDVQGGGGAGYCGYTVGGDIV